MQEIKNLLDRLFHLKWRLTFKLGQSIMGSYRGVKKQNTPIWNLSILKFYWMPLKVNEAIICWTTMAASVPQWSAKLAKGIKHPRKACCKPHFQLPWNNSKSWAGVCLFPICLMGHQSHLPANRVICQPTDKDRNEGIIAYCDFQIFYFETNVPLFLFVNNDGLLESSSINFPFFFKGKTSTLKSRQKSLKMHKWHSRQFWGIGFPWGPGKNYR